MTAPMTITLTGEEAGGSWSLIEYVAPPHFRGPPPHVHEHEQESFFVMEGTVAFVVDGRTVTAPSGTLVSVPPGTIHTFFNPTPDPATYLAWFSPIGMEQACEEMASLVAAEQVWPPADPGKLAALWRRHTLHTPA